MARVFGLTGGIASGKTTVARRFESLGIPVVYADELARDVVARGTDGLSAIVTAFGEGVLDASGDLDRKKLGAIVFADAEKRSRLNAIVHPRVGAAGLARFSELFASGHPLVCYEVPLLVESGLTEMFRPIVVVAAPAAVQIARTMSRDGLTEEEARQRVASQLPLADKIAVADYVIENTGSEEALARRVEEVAAAIRSSETAATD